MLRSTREAGKCVRMEATVREYTAAVVLTEALLEMSFRIGALFGTALASAMFDAQKGWKCCDESGSAYDMHNNKRWGVQ